MNGGCPYIAGPACVGCDGFCWEPVQLEPTGDEACEAMGHPPYAEQDGRTSCYCGATDTGAAT